MLILMSIEISWNSDCLWYFQGKYQTEEVLKYYFSCKYHQDICSKEQTRNRVWNTRMLGTKKKNGGNMEHSMRQKHPQIKVY